MELRHLRYFVAVAEELSYRKAAEQLRVAQPALSSQIKDLEGEVGVRLFDRNTAGVRLTEAGVVFLAETRATLAQAARATAAAQEVAQGRRGRLGVGYSGPLLMGFMPERVQQFRAQFPEVEISLVEMVMAEQIPALEAGAIHVGFALGDMLPIPASLSRVEILRSPVRLVVGHGHPLAKARGIALADLAAERLLYLANRKGTLLHDQIIRRFFTVRGLKPGPLRKVEGSEAFRAALESGLGVSLMPQMGSLARNPDLMLKPLRDTGEDLNLRLLALWNSRSPSVIVDNFIAILRELKPTAKKGR
jgi:DNA-binding transcriptional LysR family regulator